MVNREIVICEDHKEIARYAAKDFMNTIVSAVSKRGTAFVVLSGGSTPRTLFHLLGQEPYQAAIPWDKIHFFWADERMVPHNDPESNYHQAKTLLFQHVSVDHENIHPVNSSLPPVEAAAAYATDLKNFAADGSHTPVFDWCLLGMGEDGHTASLFPGSTTDEKSTAQAVEANYQGRPARRVTLTPLALNQSRRILFLVSGVKKAETASLVLNGPGNPSLLPAQRIQPQNGKTFWILDRAAAKHLN